MSSLYLWLNLGSICIPFLFSFHPNLKFYKKWGTLFPAIVITLVLFIIWDIVFTRVGIWGFTDNYLLKITFLDLPLEEWLFFFCIPYACVFTHYSLLHYFPGIKLSLSLTKSISYFLTALLLITLVINYDKWYTLINFLYAILLIKIVILIKPDILQTYYFTFLVILIPFFLVNGILTGSFIEDQIVWYNNNENLGIRLFTIPLEDVIYAFSLILTCIFIMKVLEDKLVDEIVN